ncbi:MAG: hypothetical protein E7622_02275 [Ruminococcaceae bacterium]|nr:hypothetical protein [Oscillospiraceae bacterium]
MKKSIKLTIVLALTVLLCTLLAIFVSAEAYTVEYYNTDGGSRKATENTAEDGSITLKETGYDTNAEKVFYGWFTEDGTFYKPGETVVFTQNMKLQEAVAFDITSVDKMGSKGGQIVRLTQDITITSKKDFDWWTTHYIDLNGYTFTIDVTGKKCTALAIQRGSVRFLNSAEQEGKVVALVDDGCALIHLRPHGYGDGKNNRLCIGKNVNVETTGALIYVDGSMIDNGNLITNPRLDLYGTVKAKTLVRQYRNNLQYDNAAINIYDGASVELTGNTWWENFNTSTGKIQTVLTMGDVAFKVADPATFDWNLAFLSAAFNVTGGSYNMNLPDGILKNGYEAIYNSETGLYDVEYVPCTLEGSNGVHTFVPKESYEGMVSTCTGLGVYYFRCDCGKFYVDTVEAVGHSYDVLVSETPATCTTKAYKIYKCIRCDSTNKVEYGNALGHDHSVISIEKIATATENGVKRVSCSRCSDAYTYEYSFDPREQVITIVVKTEDGTKEITASVDTLYNVTVSESTSGFVSKFTGVKTITDPDNPEKTYTIADVVKLVIPAGITEIASGSVKNATNIKEIVLLDGANLTFAKNSISNSPSLENITVGNCTVVFSSYVIEGNVNNLTIDVSKANATLKEYAFADKSGVKKFLMGSGKAYHFQKEVFRKTGLEEFIIPDYTSEFSAAYATFFQTYSLKYVYVGRGITSLDNIFDQCDYLQTLVLMDVTEITGQYFTCCVNKGEDVLRIYHHADQLNVRQGNFLYQSYGVILYTNALNFTTTPASIGSSNVTKTVNGVEVTYPAYTIVRGIPHEYKEGNVDATCTAMGSTGYTTNCPCGVVANATYTTYKAVSPNTAVNGTTAIAGEIVIGATTDALGHEFDEADGATVVATTPATCIKDATTTYKCARCDETLTVVQENTATGHNIEGVEWEIKIQAACATDGLKQKNCKDCKALAESEIIPATGHDIEGVEWEKTADPTCTLAGTEAKKCKTCSIVVATQPIAALGHNPGEFTTVLEPDCDDSGLKEQYCTRCNVLIATQAIEKLGHEFDVSNGAVLSGMEYPNGFNKAGAILTKCARCDETSGAEVDPIFEAKGYSTNPDKNAINGGYSVNTELLALYESYNGAITYGVVIANANSFTGSFFNNGAVNTEKAIQVPITMKSYSNFDLTLSGFGANADTLELVICAYVIDEDGNATFIQAENNYAVAIEIGGAAFTKVTLALVVANATEQPDALVPSSDEE